MSAWELTNITVRLLLPPGILIVLALVGLALVRARVRYGVGITMFSLIALYAFSTPFVAGILIGSLYPSYADPANDRNAGAIVVLGGGSRARSPEYGTDTPNPETLDRLRYAVHLHRRTGKPILVTGGNPHRFDLSEAAVMKAALLDFGVDTKWVEGDSDNTIENARLSAPILKKAGIQSVYLVTHAWHMPRARMAFERAGLHVIPAPMAYSSMFTGVTALHFVPTARALDRTYIFFHEILGLLWYRLRFDLGL